MKDDAAIAALTALAQPSRLTVFRLLVRTGPKGLPATHIAEELSIPPSSLSFHLKELAHAGMVTQTRRGRQLIYTANFHTMNGLLRFLTEDCCGGNLCSPIRLPVCEGQEPQA